MKDVLMKRIAEQVDLGSRWERPVLVSVDEFFNGNDVLGSFAANACTEEIDVCQFHDIFKEIENRDDVRGVWIEIVDIDDNDEWPYSDTGYLITSASESEINTWFGEGFPSDIRLVSDDEEVRNYIVINESGFNLYSLWWD